MQRFGNRTIRINKKELIERIEYNKNVHIQDYEQAVVDYKIEATKQLTEQLQQVAEGSTNVRLVLKSPVNLVDRYNKIIEIFKWEQDDVVTITQDEFNDYILDEAEDILSVKSLNGSYRTR